MSLLCRCDRAPVQDHEEERDRPLAYNALPSRAIGGTISSSVRLQAATLSDSGA